MSASTAKKAREFQGVGGICPQLKRKPMAKKIERAPLDGYKEITRQEQNELKRLSVKEAVRRLEILLKEAAKWRR